jgi:peptidoglycan/xylan/chitin deacetylase (PgdA/CDA1 family)
VGGNGFDKIGISTFREHIDYLSAVYDIVDLDEILINAESNEKRVALTFDDGTVDFYENVLPVLEEYQVEATVFLIGKAIKNPEFRHDDKFEYEYMTFEQIEELVSNPLVTVGNHSWSHRDLTQLEDSDELAREVKKGKAYIQDTFGITVDRFSYPYNAYDIEVVQRVSADHKFAVRDGGWMELITDETVACSLPRSNGAIPISQLKWELNDNSSKLGRLIPIRG